MSRPPPLKPVPAFKSPNVRLEADGLTPRTPHSSRKAAPSSNAHRARQQLDTTELDEIDLLSSPDKQRLLAVPGSGSTDHGRSSPVRTPGQPPLGSPWMNTMGSLSSATLGIVFAIVIIGLMGISIFAPEILESSHASDAASLNNTPLANPSLDPTVAPPLSEANDTSILDVPVPPTNSNPHPHPHDPPERIIDYSKYTSFPLTPHQYAEECWVQFKHHGHGAFWAAPHDGIADVAQHISDSDPKYCSTSVTYLLDGSSSGLVAELAVIAQVAQLAIDRKRPFFILDKYWNRGAWSDYFDNVPSHQTDVDQSGCLPPPPEELVACPRLANHWVGPRRAFYVSVPANPSLALSDFQVVSFRTAKFHLLHDFSEQFENAHASSVQRQRPIYERAVKSFTSVIQPNARVRSFIDAARTELLPSYSPTPTSYVAVHMRHGDLKPQSLRYGLQPIPVGEYANGISEAIDEFALCAPTDKPLVIYAASDSVEAINDLQALQSSERPPKCARKVVSLASSRSPEIRELVYPRLDGYRQNDWSGSKAMLWTDEERVRYTTGIIVDLALLGGLWQPTANEGTGLIIPSAVICGVKSTICTTMALGLGFDRAFARDRGLRWIDIDGRGDVEPVWQAFHLAF